ncbi:MAG TPA: hypothetical protein VFJ12_02620, partial [Segeticoccus sp.]|nr:hypothetical protein [Segeticoccus sp.]
MSASEGAGSGHGRLRQGAISAGRLRQSAIFRAGVSGARPAVPTSWPALEEAARRRMSRQGWAYVAGGAGAETTMAANRRGFEEL